jgi:hypothetical protein
MNDDALRQLASLGKGLVQVNLKLSKLTELVEAGSSGAKDAPPELLLDLLEAVELTLERRAPPPAPAPPPRWAFWRRAPPIVQLADLQGLQLARDQVVEQLAKGGICVIPLHGPADPALHRVIDTRPTADPALDRTIAATHRRGWYRPPSTIVRLAHVTAWRLLPPSEP